MIQSLYIRNYVLIDQLEMKFSGGFTTLTGETGAGKSILMGALSLILGNRVDTSVLKLQDAKCIVEGTFLPEEILRPVFEAHELDYEPVTILRREIAPGGKSRAFINDTPVNLQVMKEVGNRLVDIHSQHQNLQLKDHLYQLEVIDHFSGAGKELSGYQDRYNHDLHLDRELRALKQETAALKEELDFMQFQLNELEAAKLREGELVELEEALKQAEHAEEISHAFLQASDFLSAESTGILERLKEIRGQMARIGAYSASARELAERLETVYIDLKDMSAEVQQQADQSDTEPERLRKIQERLDLIYSLMHKHRVRNEEELITIRERLAGKVETLSVSEEDIDRLEKARERLRPELERMATDLHRIRAGASGEMQKRIQEMLQQLGIPHARFEVKIDRNESLGPQGYDEVRFLFSANKQMEMEEISRVASGGEVSRLMLCIKSLISDRAGLPTLIFDEIDAGVSGEVADQVGGIMSRLATGRQVMAITHLPQVASRGSDHFVVYKEETAKASYTRIKKLEPEDRVAEIARMLSGKEVTDEALSNARVLLRV
ncbi:MAG: DNA repair protein RecN [Bacteroidales bacterium]